MNVPRIFCPRCDALVLKQAQCSTCNWERRDPDRTAGQIVWRQKLPGQLALPYVTFAADDHLLFAPEEDRQLTSTVHALDLQTGETRWTYRLPAGRVIRHLVLGRNLLFLAPEDTRVLGEPQVDLLALDPVTGQVVWRSPLPTHSLSPPLLLDDRLFVTGSGGGGYLLAQADGRLLETVSALPSWLPLQPVLLNDQVFLNGQSHQITRVDPLTGETRPLFSTAAAKQWFDKALATAGHLILAANWDRHLYAIDAESGAVAWQAPLERGASSPPAADQHAYIGLKRLRTAGGPRVYGLAAFDLQDGAFRWFYDTERHVEAPPLALDDQLFVAGRKGRLAALQATDGQPAWEIELGERPCGAPLVAGDLLFTGTQAGEIIAISVREPAIDWAVLEEPAAYRARGEWLAAGTAAALDEQWLAAAADFTRAGEHGYAARLFARGGDWQRAADSFIEIGDRESALSALRAGQDHAGAAALLLQMTRPEEAARLYKKVEKWPEAARAYQEAGMLAQAAPLYAQAGQPEVAADLYLKLDRPSDATRVLVAAGQYDAAVRIFKESGMLAEAAQLLEGTGKLTQAAALWRSSGQEEEALRLYLQKEDFESALEIAQARNDWALVRRLAFDLNRFELEATACLRLAAVAEGNVKFDHFIAAGKALTRAARALEAEQTNSFPALPNWREEVARLWEEAAAAFEQGYETPELIYQCRREVRRLRQLPELTLDVATARELFVGEYHTLVVNVTNVGFGLARRISMRVLGDLFDGDADQTQHLTGLRPGQSQQFLMRVKPKPEAIGSAVPLDLALLYSLPNNENFTREVRGQVPVQKREPGHPTPSPLDPLADRLKIDVYHEEQSSVSLEMSLSAPPGLRQKMVNAFSESDVRDIAFDLGIDFELLPGRHKGDKIRELIIYCEKKNRMDALLLECRKRNPNIDWRGEGQP